ncbi:MAG: helix-turn-helix domain-containing protein [Paracoccus sp.]|nr:helix-turn-helix domain-containing protein [Paracoccus sp. (in: a-proteobacteria)]
MNETLRSIGAMDASALDADRQRLVAAAVTAATILEPAASDPRLHGLPMAAPGMADAAGGDPGSRGAITLASVNGATVPLEPAATSLRAVTATACPAPSFAPSDGLRLIPLAGFHWGGAVRGRNMPPAPRVRGDHVLIVLEQGMVQIELPRQQHMLRPGRVAFIPAGTAFALQPGTEVTGRALLIAPAHGRDLMLALPTAFQIGTPADDDRPMIEPAMLALGAAQLHGPAGETAAACQLGLLAVALSRLDARPGPRNADQSGIAEARPLTERFLELALAELAQSQTIAEMARKLGHSQAHLDRACRQSRGRGALELLYDLRLQHAAKALRNSTRPIAEIAQEAGYAGLGHFMRSFAAATGCSPEAYRDIMRGAPEDSLGGQFS